MPVEPKGRASWILERLKQEAAGDEEREEKDWAARKAEVQQWLRRRASIEIPADLWGPDEQQPPGTPRVDVEPGAALVAWAPAPGADRYSVLCTNLDEGGVGAVGVTDTKVRLANLTNSRYRVDVCAFGSGRVSAPKQVHFTPMGHAPDTIDVEMAEKKREPSPRKASPEKLRPARSPDKPRPRPQKSNRSPRRARRSPRKRDISNMVERPRRRVSPAGRQGAEPRETAEYEANLVLGNLYADQLPKPKKGPAPRERFPMWARVIAKQPRWRGLTAPAIITMRPTPQSVKGKDAELLVHASPLDGVAGVVDVRWGWRGREGHVLGFTVLAARAGKAARWFPVKEHQYGETACAVDRLQPGRRYHFLVVAHGLGHGEFGYLSNIVEATTEGAAEPGAPTGVTFRAEDWGEEHGGLMAVLTWKPPAPEGTTAQPVEGYHVLGPFGEVLQKTDAETWYASFPRFEVGEHLGVATVVGGVVGPTAWSPRLPRAPPRVMPAENTVVTLPAPTVEATPEGPLVTWNAEGIPAWQFFVVVKAAGLSLKEGKAARVAVRESPKLLPQKLMPPEGFGQVAIEYHGVGGYGRGEWTEGMKLCPPHAPTAPVVELEDAWLRLSWDPPSAADYEYTVVLESHTETGVGMEVAVGYETSWSVSAEQLVSFFEEARVRFAVVAKLEFSGTSKPSEWSKWFNLKRALEPESTLLEPDPVPQEEAAEEALEEEEAPPAEAPAPDPTPPPKATPAPEPASPSPEPASPSPEADSESEASEDSG